MNNFENCGYYIDDECTICGMGTDGEDTFCKYCKDNPNCYYKQLAELKAENDKLKQTNKELAHYLACMTEQRNRANTCLQEIKTIVYANQFDFAAGSIISYQAIKEVAKIFEKILDLITKAEEE